MLCVRRWNGNIQYLCPSPDSRLYGECWRRVQSSSTVTSGETTVVLHQYSYRWANSSGLTSIQLHLGKLQCSYTNTVTSKETPVVLHQYSYIRGNSSGLTSIQLHLGKLQWSYINTVTYGADWSSFPLAIEGRHKHSYIWGSLAVTHSSTVLL